MGVNLQFLSIYNLKKYSKKTPDCIRKKQKKTEKD